MGINYLISGHSYNENDTAHSVIESAFRKNTLYTMAQWETAIQMAFKKSPAEVNVLTHRDIADFQNPDAFPEYSDVLSDKVYENDNSSLKKESKIYWSKLMRIKFSNKTQTKCSSSIIMETVNGSTLRFSSHQKLARATRGSWKNRGNNFFGSLQKCSIMFVCMRFGS